MGRNPVKSLHFLAPIVQTQVANKILKSTSFVYRIGTRGSASYILISMSVVSTVFIGQ